MQLKIDIMIISILKGHLNDSSEKSQNCLPESISIGQNQLVMLS
jgi:hypothetical protein